MSSVVQGILKNNISVIYLACLQFYLILKFPRNTIFWLPNPFSRKHFLNIIKQIVNFQVVSPSEQIFHISNAGHLLSYVGQMPDQIKIKSEITPDAAGLSSMTAGSLFLRNTIFWLPNRYPFSRKHFLNIIKQIVNF